MQRVVRGIGSYTHFLVKYLQLVDKENDYLIYLCREDEEDLNFITNNNFYKIYAKMPTRSAFLRLLWEQVYLQLKLASKPVEVFHGPAFIVPNLKFCKYVVTALDATHWLHPKTHTFFTLLYMRPFVRLSLWNADMIITISESAKKDLINSLGLPEDKIKVIYCGIDEAYQPTQNLKSIEATRKKFNLPEKFILNVSTLVPTKNLPTLFKAFALFKSSTSLSHRLVIVGGKGWKYKEILKAVTQLGLEKDIIFTGYVPREDLINIYNAADLFVYPSFYEGFGLPPLEAMACGTPVIASNVSSIPEVVGEAGILLNPFDIAGIAEAIEKVIRDDDLRREMVEKGITQAQKFSWRQNASETKKIYERLVKDE